jgi:CRISPR-associated endonuclease/helicase Cas3
MLIRCYERAPLPTKAAPVSFIVHAHSIAGQPEATWELLSDHLAAVGGRAAEFAQAIGAAPAGLVMGLLHDIGKCSAAYQRYIRAEVAENSARGPDHSSAGAREALRIYADSRPLDRIMAYGIAGHHSGLMDGGKLRERETKQIDAYSGWEDHAYGLPGSLELKTCLSGFAPNKFLPLFTPYFMTRMLFSCLVDADSLETERFYAEADDRSAPERGGCLCANHLAAVRAFMAEHRQENDAVNRLRSQILDHAVSKAAMPPGLFTLTVPTGGGKTLTSLSFALEHAAIHGMRRVVYVIPFTSVIEQTAGVFRDALGPDLEADVLEHHSSFDWEQGRAGDSDGEGQAALARLQRDAENWDAPIVVTTAVQFFESLFAAQRSRARKLHNLARSVIIIDEAQSIPVHLLRPSLAAIDELARNYGATVVLCTATQPALRLQDQALPQTEDMKRAGRREGLDIPPERELAPDPPGLYHALRRVGVEWRQEAVPDAEIAARFAEQPQMLCIVNSRGHARTLFEAIAALPGACHLTTLMCAAHRRRVLNVARQRLKDGLPVRLVATSLIEAGVDVSFPEVWRAAAGLSSIAQAAGRCNRSSELGPLGEVLGRVVVFEPAEAQVPPFIDAFYTPARTVLRSHTDDVLSENAIQAYYKALYRQQGYAALDRSILDGNAFPIIPALRGAGIDFPFRSISDAYRFIDDTMEPVLIPYDETARAALYALRHARVPPAGIHRRLQQYVVPIPASLRRAMLAEGLVAPVREDCGERFLSLCADDSYDHENLGLCIEVNSWRRSEANVI